MVKIKGLSQTCLIYLLRFYRYFFSPFLGQACRFYPTCSEYAQLAIQEYGSFIGVWMTIKRLLCCHPWHSGGYYPVKKRKNSIKMS